MDNLKDLDFEIEFLETEFELKIKLPVKYIQVLKELAIEDGVTATSVLKSAISTYQFIREKLSRGASIFIKLGDDLRSLCLKI